MIFKIIIELDHFSADEQKWGSRTQMKYFIEIEFQLCSFQFDF